MLAPTSLGPAFKRLMLADVDLSRFYQGELRYSAEKLEAFFTRDLVAAAAEAELDLALDLVRCHGDGVTLRGTVTFPARLAMGQVKAAILRTAPWVWDVVHDAVVVAGFDLTFRLEKVDLKQPPGKLFASLRFDELGVLRVGDLSLSILGKLPILKNILGAEALEEAALRWLSKHMDHELVEGHLRAFHLGSAPALGTALEKKVNYLGYALRWPDVFDHVRAEHSHEGVTVRVDLNEAVVVDLARRFVAQRLMGEAAKSPKPAKTKPAAKAKPGAGKAVAAKARGTKKLLAKPPAKK